VEEGGFPNMLSGGPEKHHNNPQASQSPCRDMKPGPPR